MKAMDKEFLAAYSRLNKAQKAAVDSIEGPVLVIAGPGTGKTQLLSMRVANILLKTDTDPTNILCLTFTNFAANNMRERLHQLIGTPAHKVIVRTFHSFAAEIMNTYPDYFWNGAALKIVPDTIQLEIIQDILGQLPLDNPLAAKFAGAYTAMNDVQQALRLAKEAGLTPSKLAAMLAVNVAYIDVTEPRLVELLSPALAVKKLGSLLSAVEALPDQPIDDTVTPLASLSIVLKTSLALAVDSDLISGKTTETGKWKRRWLQTVGGQKGLFDERRRNSWWQALAEIYERYREQLHARGYYDYADMIIEVITQLEQQSELQAQVQENYNYVLIDEFQDTNAAQLRLSHLVATHPSSEGRPNLMAVGDDDQSIFAFNGAELNNMLRFQQTYPATQTIVLTDNYRSTQKLLDFAQTIIEQADDRLVKRRSELDKHLKAVAAPPAGTLQHLRYPTREHQLFAIAKHVQQTWEADTDASLAVLGRSHDSLRSLSAYLSRLHVPISYEQQNNVLDQPLITQLTMVAEIVVDLSEGNEAGVNANLARLLTHPVWAVDAKILWQFAISNRREAHWLDTLLKSSDKRLKGLATWLLWLSAQSVNEPLAVLIEYIIGLRESSEFTSPLHAYFISLRPLDNSYLEALSGLQVIQNLVTEFVGDRSSSGRLADYVRFIRLNRQHGRLLTNESWFVSGDRAVQLLTIHKAKGLEFDSVFLVDAIEDNWQPRRLGRKPPANLPLQPYGEQYDDYVRLAYVAATRAKRSLIVTSYHTDAQGKALLATPLLQALPTKSIDITSAADSVAALEASLGWPRLQTNQEKALLGPRLASYSLNATALLQFLDVTTGGPLHFLETQFLHLPQITTISMAYGTAIHKALQTAQLLTNSRQFNLETVLATYHQCLIEQQLPMAETARYQVHGEQVLTKLFNSGTFQLTSGGLPELTIREAPLGKARLSGTLDRVDITKDQIVISDYKTGVPLINFETRDRTKAIKAWRHSSQLLFYTLLVRQSPHFNGKQSIRGQMIYVEAENPKTLRLGLQPDQQALDRMQALIAVVWKHLMHLDFPDTSHYPQTLAGIKAFEADLLHNTQKIEKLPAKSGQ
jgi:DNA helicase II / ATP-dependent DNA helicase PcrA